MNFNYTQMDKISYQNTFMCGLVQRITPFIIQKRK